LDFVNAFALPGGPVFIGGGLMALMDTEDELASVLGHEIEHIDHYHCAERVQIEAALQKVPLGGLAALPVEVFVAGYSKDQELEADREGAKLAVAALYSPQGAIQMFEAFERFEPTKIARSKTPQEELSQVALETLEGYFQSHPLNAERIDQIQKMIAAGQLPGWQTSKPMAVAYVFLTERAWRSLQAAQTRTYPFLSYKEKRKREAERIKQFNDAMQLASQSLSLRADQPLALEIVALAHFGLGDYEAAEATYRKLLPDYPTFADSIRIYADSMARQALDAQLYEQAKKLATASLELQVNQPEALTILAEAQLHLSDFAGAAESGSKLRNLDSQAASELSVYAGQVAATNFSLRKYREAEASAALSVELKADQWESLATLANAQFALAEFSEAGGTYRKLLDFGPSNMKVVRSYADALSASHPSAPEIGEWLARVHFNNPAAATQVRVELAGLMLMSGDEQPTRSLILEAQGVDSSLVATESLGRLGWWYYRAGKYSESAELLLQAVAQRPGDLTLQAALAFDELEQRQPDDAIRRFSLAIADDSWNSPRMGRAVAHWQAHQTEEALKDFKVVVKALPEWQNPRWVEGLYSRGLAQSVAEMEAEWRKRPAASH
jgi:predicted Zn-dependent protease